MVGVQAREVAPVERGHANSGVLDLLDFGLKRIELLGDHAVFLNQAFQLCLLGRELNGAPAQHPLESEFEALQACSPVITLTPRRSAPFARASAPWDRKPARPVSETRGFAAFDECMRRAWHWSRPYMRRVGSNLRLHGKRTRPRVA